MTHIEAVAFMIKNKVLHMKLPDGLEVTLTPDAFLPATPVGDVDTGGPPLDVRGRGGQTRAEQLELFGTTYEADFSER